MKDTEVYMNLRPDQERETKTLPEFFRPLFWSYRFEGVDPRRDKTLIIRQTVLYGDLTHLRWVVEHYGRAEVGRILSTLSPGEIRPSAQKLFSLLFDVSFSSHAPRGTR